MKYLVLTDNYGSEINRFNLVDLDKVDYVSTAGGAFLEMLEGKILPAVAALEASASS